MSEESVDPFGHPRIPYRGYYDRRHCDDRRAWAEKFAGSSLEQCGQWWLREGTNDSYSCTKLKGNLENVIGLAKVPLGVCGPLLFNGEDIKGYYLCPFATTEGALVASVTRGATALTRSGGVYAKVLESTQIRSPYFRLRSMHEVDLLTTWIASNSESIKNRVQLYSQHAQLKRIHVTHHTCVAVAHFEFSTEDACGQNMVTSVTSHLCKWILTKIESDLPRVNVVHYCIESGLSGDKSMAFRSLWRTRGHHVQAEAWIPEDILKSVLKVDVPTIAACYHEWQHLLTGAGRVGFGINVANLITGVFIATGQDVAAIESCHSNLSLSVLSSDEIESIGEVYRKESFKRGSSGKKPSGIYVSIAIPSLNVGTVGGGTSLATQKECLHLIDCYGKGNVARLCELIAGYALSLEVSTLAALASGQFASAHEKLGRNHPTLGFKEENFNEEFFSEVLGSEKKLLEMIPFKVDTGNSILSEITKTELSKKVGHFGYILKFSDCTGGEETIQMVIKSKTTAVETCNMLNKMAQSCGQNLAIHYQKYKMVLGFEYCDIREVEIYNSKNVELRKFFPQIYHTVLHPSKDVFVIAMEYLTDEGYTHLNTVNRIEDWTTSEIKVVLRDLARLHSVYFCKTEELESFEWMLKRRVGDKASEMCVLWAELLKHAHYEFPEVWSEQRIKVMENAILKFHKINSLLSVASLTLIHNDCNPRNLCLRKSDGRKHRTCLYDWELATLDVPQRDVVEFLGFVLPPSSSLDTRLELIDFYRCNLEHYSGIDYPLDRFMEVYNASVLDFAIRRLLMYTMAHTFKDYTYLPRVVDSVFAYIEGVGEECFHLITGSKL